ncbi:unnamed protein product [Symbiodinium sp. KB8]|nr:unnamed protein product [Symbiodinium sp. KB8]
MVVDPTGKLLTKRRQSAYIYSDAILHFVTKFKHLVRRARSSHQAQLRELKTELAGYFNAGDGEQSELAEDEDAALPVLTEHDEEEASKNKKPKKGVQPDIERKLLPEQVMESLRGLLPSESKPVKPFLPSAQLRGCILDLTLWAKDDEGRGAAEEVQGGQKRKKNLKAKGPKASEAQAQQNPKKDKKKKPTSNTDQKKESSRQEQGEEPEAMKRMKRTMAPDCAYVPGTYKEARLSFIAKKRDRGFSWKEACQKWNQSSKRARWLEGLSKSELSRRRFV